MSNSTVKRIGVMTGGGDCPGLNAVIRAVTKAAMHTYSFEVLGVHDGFLGLIDDHVTPLTFDNVSNILNLGGTILGTSNKANPSRHCVGHDASGEPIFENRCDQVLATAKRHGIDVLVCIGGDGTMSAAAPLIERGLRVVGVPKTIDNDLMHTDVTFGFDTAVSTAAEAFDRIRTTAASHSRVMLVETMGRTAGWIALYAGAATGADVILIPEIEYDVEEVCRVCTERSKYGKAFTIIAISEGAKPKGGEMVVDRVVHESPDPIRLGGVSEVLCDQISERTKLESRATILGHVQRGGTPTARDRVLATRFGYHAIELIMRGQFNHLVTMQGGKLTSVPIDAVANRVKLVPLDHEVIRALRAIGVSFGDR